MAFNFLPRSREKKVERERLAEEAQARFDRRKGEVIELPKSDGSGFEEFTIVDVVRGDDGSPVILKDENGNHTTIPALSLERFEHAAKATIDLNALPEAKKIVKVKTLPDAEPEVVRKEKFRRRYGVVDVSEAVEDRARDSAEEELHRDKSELKGVSGFLAKIFKHNLGYEIYRQIGINRSRQKILGEKNLYANEGAVAQEHHRAVGAVVDRFVAEHDEFLHTEGKKGERRKVFGDSEAEKSVKGDLNALVREYAANPEMTAEELDARRTEIFGKANKLADEAKGQGLMYADNLETIAEELRVAARHAGGLDNLDVDLDFVIGKAKLGARTEREGNIVDKTLEKLERWGKDHNIAGGMLGLIRNELAVALGAAVAIGNAVGRTALSSNAGKVLTFGGSGVVTGLYSWWKEKGRLNRERSLHERQMALGGNVDTELDEQQLDAAAARRTALSEEYDATPIWRPLKRYQLSQELKTLYASEKPRRDTMETFALARASAKDLAYGGMGFLTADGQLKPDIDRAIAMQALADMDARVRMSNSENVDLLRYSSVVEAEVERRNLDFTRMRLKAALRATNPEFQAQFDEMLQAKMAELYGDEESGVRVTQEKFAKYANRRAIKTGLATAAIGASVGYAAHEVWALASGNETVTGSIGRFAGWLKDYMFGHAPTAAVGAPHVETIAGGIMSSPSGTHFVPEADGTFTLESISDHTAIASGLHIGNDGMLDLASRAKLEGLGASIVEKSSVMSHTETVTERVSNWDWLHAHAPEVSHIKRDIWLGNDTPAPVFDFNEQGLDWGKVAGVNANGDYVMDMSSMTSGGSWQGAMHVDALKEMVDGKMRLVLTMSTSTQNHAVEILIDEHGQAIIPANSDIAQTFFATQGGKAVFLGKYAEVALDRGIDAKGVDHLAILATHIGKGLKEGVITREIGECVPLNETQILLPSSPDLILPPIIPLRPRTPLERLGNGKKNDVVKPVGEFAGGEGGEDFQEELNIPDYSDVLAALSRISRNNPEITDLVLRAKGILVPVLPDTTALVSLRDAELALGLPSGLSRDQVRRALRKALAESHPDSLRADSERYDQLLEIWKHFRLSDSKTDEAPDLVARIEGKSPLQIEETLNAMVLWKAPIDALSKEEEQYFTKRRKNGKLNRNEFVLDLILAVAQRESRITEMQAKEFKLILEEALKQSRTSPLIKSKKRKGMDAILKNRMI